MRRLLWRAFARLSKRPIAAEDLWVSIVVNTLNRAASLQRTLAGLDRLADDNFEVIVVAGPCTDDTGEVLRRYAGRIRVGHCPAAVLGQSRNIGVAMAAGDIVAFTDDDAIPRRDWLAELRRGYADPAVGGVGGHVYDAVNGCMQWRACSSTRVGAVSVDTAPPYDGYQGPDADPYLYLCGCNMSYRRADLFAAGGFNEELRSVYDDVEIAGRIHRANRRIVSSDGPMVDHFMDSSHIRDGKRAISDPYNIVHDFSTFVMHSRMTHESDTAAIAAATEQVRYWHYIASLRLRDGEFTQGQHDEFVRRADQGLGDGLASGASGRKMRTFRPTRKWRFRRFKT